MEKILSKYSAYYNLCVFPEKATNIQNAEKNFIDLFLSSQAFVYCETCKMQQYVATYIKNAPNIFKDKGRIKVEMFYQIPPDDKTKSFIFLATKTFENSKLVQKLKFTFKYEKNQKNEIKNVKISKIEEHKDPLTQVNTDKKPKPTTVVLDDKSQKTKVQQADSINSNGKIIIPSKIDTLKKDNKLSSNITQKEAQKTNTVKQETKKNPEKYIVKQPEFITEKIVIKELNKKALKNSFIMFGIGASTYFASSFFKEEYKKRYETYKAEPEEKLYRRANFMNRVYLGSKYGGIGIYIGSTITGCAALIFPKKVIKTRIVPKTTASIEPIFEANKIGIVLTLNNKKKCQNINF